MELLVVTLAHTAPGRDTDGLARIRLISDTVRNAPGLVTARFYRSRGHDSYYFMLTTWEDEESWRRAQERHNPKQLLIGTGTELLLAPPEQWLMRYLWGYSRPLAAPILAVAHLATVRPDQRERTQRGWIESLHRQAVQPTLAFAFLARGANEDTLPPGPSPAASSMNEGESPYQQGSIFLNLLCWASEADREDFYMDPNYRAISIFLNSVGIIQLLALDPI
jgi:heme-degrading monooxygenase HmoA